MGLFQKTKCPICKQEIGVAKKALSKYNGDYLCVDCYDKILRSGNIVTYKSMTLEQLIELVNNPISPQKQNNIGTLKSSVKQTTTLLGTKRIGKYLEIDEKNKYWRVPDFLNNNPFIPYSAILDYELLEDGSSITKGGASVGRAAVGGTLLGLLNPLLVPTGMIIGGVTGKRKQKNFCTTMQIKVTVNRIETPTVYIKFISSKTKKTSAAYKNACKYAQEVLSVLNVITNANDKETDAVPQISAASSADEIKKYKELLDDGVITKEEFEMKKKQLLGL